jgi:hypothetical protein
VRIAQLLLPMSILAVLPKLAVASRFFKELTLNGFVVAVRELVEVFALLADFLDVVVR